MKQTAIIPSLFSFHFTKILFVTITFFAILGLSSSSFSAEPAVHTLNASISGQGSISPCGELSVTEGSSKSFVLEAGDNHHIVDVIVDGVSMGPAAAISLENIAASHTIEAVFESDCDELATASGADAKCSLN